MIDAVAPVRQQVKVPLAPDRAYSLFFQELPSWWPTGTHSVHGEAVTVEVTGGPAGTVVEVAPTGERIVWARVLVWDPPHRLVVSWNPSPTRTVATEVEVRFRPDGDGTIVELEHRGWDRLGDEGVGLREEYEVGWTPVLQRYASAASRA